MTYLVGQRVETSKGTATIVGFEQFTHNGMKAHISVIDCGGRAVVRLDKPENWVPTLLTPDPYMFRSDLKEIS